MKKFFAAAVIVILSLLAYLWIFPAGQRSDRSFNARVARPAFPQRHPVVLFDESHYNAHTLTGGYRAFGQLLANDGYQLKRSAGPLTSAALNAVSVLVVVNAAGGSNPKLFGFNLVPLRKGRREAPAFTSSEIKAVQTWVAHGGSLLLVADHYPFGPSSSKLAAAFGVTMHGGYTEVPDEFKSPTDPSAIRFSRENKLLAESPIASGRNSSERVGQVESFTGQSLDAPNGAPLLRLPPSAVEYVPPPPKFKPQQAGAVQGTAIEYGRGRVVVLGEAAMLTAQIANGRKFGMNVSGLDNRQFALNVMHWLSRLF